MERLIPVAAAAVVVITIAETLLAEQVVLALSSSNTPNQLQLEQQSSTHQGLGLLQLEFRLSSTSWLPVVGVVVLVLAEALVGLGPDLAYL